MVPGESEIQQIPGRTTLGAVQQALHLCAIEKSCVTAKPAQLRFCAVAELPHEPVLDRHSEALFLAVDKLVRYDAANGFLQEILWRAVADFDSSRNAHHELDKFVIEKRNASFQAEIG